MGYLAYSGIIDRLIYLYLMVLATQNKVRTIVQNHRLRKSKAPVHRLSMSIAYRESNQIALHGAFKRLSNGARCVVLGNVHGSNI